MTDSGVPIRDALIKSALMHIPFDGWSITALKSGARDIGLNAEIVESVFPRGVSDAIQYFSQQTDRFMVKSMEDLDLEALRVHERVGRAVENRLIYLEPYRESVLRGLTWLSMPHNSVLGAQLLYRTVDEIWYAVGDRSADFSFYTKRGLLAGVLSSTSLFWLNDHSEDGLETRAFLYRRLADVMRLHEVSKRVRISRDSVLGSFSIFKNVIEKRYAKQDIGDSRVT
ncbi:MAG: hypothetical protein CFH41_01781 [Alphaproteobacteria bacterium MarineAlpha11_Bin1]|nr:MAG: hypothetical protein CFH41_01781 [Alphaproteobacteria bacterium MarineAlpha11_Bin1]|tara:strand:- start:9327 stop:10007 length:681 start_codon:yes stop_codon:yes gene_type:complete